MGRPQGSWGCEQGNHGDEANDPGTPNRTRQRRIAATMRLPSCHGAVIRNVESRGSTRGTSVPSCAGSTAPKPFPATVVPAERAWSRANGGSFHGLTGCHRSMAETAPVPHCLYGPFLCGQSTDFVFLLGSAGSGAGRLTPQAALTMRQKYGAKSTSTGVRSQDQSFAFERRDLNGLPDHLVASRVRGPKVKERSWLGTSVLRGGALRLSEVEGVLWWGRSRSAGRN